MPIKLLLLCLFLVGQSTAQSYKKIHRKAIVVDTHNDILMKAADKGMIFDQDLTGKTASDLGRWKTGGLDVQVFSVYCDGDLKNSFAYANREMDSLDAVVARNSGKIVKVAGYKELIEAVKQHKIAAMFGVEGGHMIEDDLDKLQALYDRGTRYLTLTHNIAPSWATSAVDETTKPNLPHKGLTDFGRQVVQRMNQLGMIIDISHAGDQTFWDAINMTKKPVIASHSSVYSLVPHPRNLKDDQIKAIAKNGGVIQVNFHPGFIDSSFGKKEIDASQLEYHSETFDLKEAAKRENAGKPRSAFINKTDVKIYPDTLVWIRDFSYSYNEPMTKRYFSHPAFGNYPVVGVNWKQAVAFCEWRTHYLNTWLDSKKRVQESNFRLPTEAQWEYASRGGRSQSMFPWGNYYLRNKKGCLLANFKPGRGNYPEDGGFYTVRADAYWPNDFGLYCMAGNVAEWTSSIYYEGSYTFQHDMNPDVRWNAKDSDPPKMKRKVIRGGSWKDVGYYLQTGARTYEYQDSTKSYIGFRSVIDLPAQSKK